MKITYSAERIDFTCASCGTACRIIKRSEEMLISGTFCQGCGEQYYTHWDGVLHRGEIVPKQKSEKRK